MSKQQKTHKETVTNLKSLFVNKNVKMFTKLKHTCGFIFKHNTKSCFPAKFINTEEEKNK